MQEEAASQSLALQPRSPPLSEEHQSSQEPWEMPCGTSWETEREGEGRSQGQGWGREYRWWGEASIVLNREGVEEGH